MTSKNTLFFGDNLEVLRNYIEDECIDLIYLDPPFKKQKKYNILYEELNGSPSEAQVMAYADTWYWDEQSERCFKELVETSSTKLAETIAGFRGFLHESDMMAYLVNMAIRLRELHRVLKPTGSIYLHCDPTASHYLKVLMDAIFGDANFQNEFIWYYSGGGASKRRWARKHDVLLFYTAGPEWTFNTDAVRVPYKWTDGQRRADGSERKLEAGKLADDVWEHHSIMPWAGERLGYPTQKPEALLERIIEASSGEGNLVLDPFCGCGTTIAVAERLGRRWIGIDITYLAIDLIKSRLYDSFGELDYEVIGEPKDLHGARELAAQDKYQFQYWTLGLVGARPPGHTQKGREGADKGIDGIKYIDEGKGEVCKIILQVKGGHVGPSQIRDLRGTVEREDAQIGAFITLEGPTKEMIKEAASAGFYHSKNWGRDYPKIQILTIEDILKGGKRLEHPPTSVTFKKATPKPKGAKAEQLGFQN